MSVGDVLAIVSRHSQACVVLIKHKVFDRNEIMHICAVEDLGVTKGTGQRRGGRVQIIWVLPNADHQYAAGRQLIEAVGDSELDEFLIMANNSFGST